MAGSLKLYPAAGGATMRVHLRDAGQDFLWLDINGGVGKIVGAGPFQGWFWKGKRVKPDQLKVGKLVPICMNRRWTTLRYPITRIERVAA